MLVLLFHRLLPQSNLLSTALLICQVELLTRTGAGHMAALQHPSLVAHPVGWLFVPLESRQDTFPNNKILFSQLTLTVFNNLHLHCGNCCLGA